MRAHEGNNWERRGAGLIVHYSGIQIKLSHFYVLSYSANSKVKAVFIPVARASTELCAPGI